MVGQLILVRMEGPTPSARFLGRVGSGEIGGVVLFGDNFGSAGPGALVRRLQRAAAEGGQPPLLIAIDQEGGVVQRLPGAPSLAPRQMTNATIAKTQGLATARNLKSYGINVDLAPVLDVGRGRFITERTFASTPKLVSVRGLAFARGLSHGGVVATGKHFPGLGYAKSNTDRTSTIIRATASQLTADLLPYRNATSHGLKVVMVSTAVYPSLGAKIPAVCSPRIVEHLLREQLGFDGVVITDALDTKAVTDYFPVSDAAVRAIGAGVDIVLAAGGTSRFADRASDAAYRAIVDATTNGTLSHQRVREAYARVLELKKDLR